MKRLFVFALCLFSVKLFAWYPDYSVMVTDFVLPDDFLEPARITSIRQLALGPHFQYLYMEPVDRAFRNSASLRELNNRYLYFEVAGNRKDDEPDYGVTPHIYYDNFLPYYWSPYRVETDPRDREPLLRMAYFGQAFGETSPVSLGFTLEYYYDQQQFYQPAWYWYGWRGADAIGESYATAESDPYDDYREVEAGDNTAIQRGAKINTFAAYSISSNLSLGFRYGLLTKNADGNYLDLDKHDESDWADEYLNYSKTRRKQVQDRLTHDISGGVLKRYENGSNIGLNIGYVFGDISRSDNLSDSTDYYSYRFYGPADTNYRESLSYGSSSERKKWEYDGATFYGTLHGERVINPDVTMRFTLYGERRSANLTESESMQRWSHHEYYYWSEYNSYAYEYANDSEANLERTGKGTYEFSRYTGSLGAEWHMSETVRFIGGLYVDYREDHKSADEPFEGEKYSAYSRTNQYDPGFESLREVDDKKFHWYRNEAYTTVAIPTGLIAEAGESVEFMIGLSKVIRAITTDEGYDLVVYHDKETRVVDNTTIITSDSSYVEGHTFPGTNEFIEEYQMNAGITLKYKENLRITGALRESILKPRQFKIGVEFMF